MRRRTVSFRPAIESPEVRLAPSTLLAPTTSAMVAAPAADDPIPDPQPTPGTYSGSNPPPTSGPVGPGT